MTETNPQGRFVWYELLCKDPDGAQAFYTEILGWGTQPFEGGPMPYTMWINNDVPIGGMMKLPKEAEEQGAVPHWLGYVAVNDIDASADQAASDGAIVLVPTTEIPGMGRFSVLKDPQGALFALYQAASPQPLPEGPPQVGEVSWHELATTDHEAAFGFYNSLVGWQKNEAMDMGEMGVYQMFGRTATPMGGMFNKPPEMPVTAWLYYVRVGDLDATLERVKGAGGQILNGPMEVPGGDLIAQCLDPQGAAFALHSSKNL